ncbi:MAG: hypothetical protein ACD_37C00390G0001 [uncultured bacterium]|nr:MAG: hypothetical protein ACD_37C00390G0001 [uncultured bacterium]
MLSIFFLPVRDSSAAFARSKEEDPVVITLIFSKLSTTNFNALPMFGIFCASSITNNSVPVNIFLNRGKSHFAKLSEKFRSSPV